jgi:hypothetical protein
MVTITIIIVMLLAFTGMGFMLYKSIKKHEENLKSKKKRKGRFK